MEIMRTIAGSHLYGTATPDSDTDYKAVHLPTAHDLLLGIVKEVVTASTGTKDVRNSVDDEDFESYTLQKFLKLAAKMTTIPVEMLFIPADKLIHNSTTWQMVVANRHRILCRNAHPFVGYCRSQAVKYSTRGDRLETFETVVARLRGLDHTSVLQDCLLKREIRFHDIPGVSLIDRPQPGGGTVRYLVVCGRQAPMTCKVKEVLDVMERPIKEYGKRARIARDAGGADWKALYHAVRIADEGIQLFNTGEITFPSKVVPLLMKIRSGQMDLDGVLDIFDQKVVELEIAAKNSDLRETPDYAWINEFVAEMHYNIVVGGY